MYFSIYTCPSCKHLLDTKILGLSSGLGPAAVCCGKCRRAFRTDRKEWPDFRRSDRVRFYIVSAVEVAVFAALGAFALGLACHFLSNGPWADAEDPVNLGSVLGIPAFLTAGAALQYRRVEASVGRCEGERRRVCVASHFDLQTSLQSKACVLLMGLGLAGWLLSYAVSLVR